MKTYAGKIPGRGIGVLRHIDRYLGILLVGSLGAMHRRRRMPAAPKSFAILNTAAIGDTILMGSVLSDLRTRYPDALFVLFAGPSNYEAARLIRGIDRVVRLPLPDIRRSLALIRDQEFDVLVDFGPWPRLNALLTRLARARFTVGFNTPAQHRHYGYDLAVEHSSERHELENHRRLIRVLGVIQHTGRGLDRSAIVTPQRSGKYAVFHLWAGGSCAQLKQWPIGRWIMLARELGRQGLEVVFTGAPVQRHANDLIISKLPEALRRRTFNAAGLSLAETASLVAHASLVVSVDTGVMHLAAALDAPLVALHGPTSPHRWGPVSDNAIVVESPLREAGYLKLGYEYPRRPPKCMEAITYASVLQACQRLLGDREMEAEDSSSAVAVA